MPHVVDCIRTSATAKAVDEQKVGQMWCGDKPEAEASELPLSSVLAFGFAGKGILWTYDADQKRVASGRTSKLGVSCLRWNVHAKRF
jgi:hypothetical protein